VTATAARACPRGRAPGQPHAVSIQRLVGNLICGLLCVLLPLATAAAQPPAAAQAPVTFTEHVAPIVFGACVGCHRPGEVAPFPLLSYADVRKRGKNVLAVIEDRYMPPWHPAPGYGSFTNEQRLTDQQIETVRAWVKAGMPEGPADKLPPLPKFTPGWQLGEPDLIVRTSGAFEVPASGRDIYRNFAIPIGLTEDKWITAIEVRPQARAVLHHTLIFLDEQQEGQALDGKDGKPGFNGMRLQRAPMIAGWAVGGMPEHLPQGLAIKLPKGSDLMLQSHLHPSGKKEKEQTVLGLYFAKEPPKRTLVSIQLPPFFGLTAGLDIPAGEADYRLRDSFELPCAVEAITVGGHAHMLCKSLWLRGEQPSGTEVPLLKIDRWDFDWQNRYTFREPVKLDKGSVLRSELVYDNSKQNPNNPNQPPKRVRWGRETTDEMGSITLLVVPADEADLPALLAAVAQKNTGRAVARAQEAVEAQFDNYDTNRDGKLSKDELPRRLRLFFPRLDRDQDGALTKDEAKAIGELLGEFGGAGGLPGGGAGGGGGGKPDAPKEPKKAPAQRGAGA
jgi:mono/diheme cytochrome c family protein